MSGPAPAALVRPPRVPKSPPPELATSRRIADLRRGLERASTPAERTQVVDTFWRDVAALGTPLIENIEGDPGHRAVTFLWRDRATREPGTRAVVLLANKLTDPSVWDRSQLVRIDGTDVWHRTYRLPPDWRATYQLAPDDGDVPAAEQAGTTTGPRARWAGVAATARPDPMNRGQFPGKPGELPTSVVELASAPPQPWRATRPEVPRGALTETAVPTDWLGGGPRRVWTYRPSEGLAPPGTEHDLLVLLDGEDWAGRLDLVSTLDNLLVEGRIRPTVAVLVDAVDTPSRWRDLSCSAAFVDFLIQDLLPWAHATSSVPLSEDPSRTILSGRSLGGITSLYAGLVGAGRIGVVHAQSPSLWWPAEPLPDGRTAGWLTEALLAAGPGGGPGLVSVEVGLQEWLLLEPARELVAALDAAGHAVRLSEYQGGHDAFCWRGGLADALAEFAARRP